MRFFLGIILASYCVACSEVDDGRPNKGADLSDGKLDPVSLINKYEYPVERHRITTQDGYILTLHRIPYGIYNSKDRTDTHEHSSSRKKKRNKGVVILLHGLFFSSLHWVISGTKRGLGYILADKGYDVWMPNFRGNKYSMRHTTYNASDSRFWDFSWHDMANYDLPAIMEYVLSKTSQHEISIIAHSQGATAFLIFNSLHPDFNDNIRCGILLAPLAYMGHTRSVLLQTLSKMHKPFKDLSSVLGRHSITNDNGFINKLIKTLCLGLRLISQELCENPLLFTTGFSLQQTNFTMLEIVMGSGLHGSSVKQLTHYAQLLKSHKFHRYDYGKENLVTYGQSYPPEYDLKKVKSPVYVYYSRDDWLADVKDVLRLITELPRVIYSHSLNAFSHIDHLFGKDVVQVEYGDIIDKLNKLH